MKKVLCIIVILSVVFLCACDYNASLRNKMVDYYSENENYSVLQGKVSSVKLQEDIREIHIMVDIVTPGHDFPLSPRTNLCEFVIVNYTEEEKSIYL